MSKKKTVKKQKKAETEICMDCGKQFPIEQINIDRHVCEDCDDEGESDCMEYGDEQWED
jgi:hypothetical protein